jgi:alkanesulfonate monooxygenase SsuD/methylene tetrahydromethanopterin reductase-like flavin-dependent oxidoreductase (luciferase family)
LNLRDEARRESRGISGSQSFSLSRLAETVDAARECGFSSVSANDHFLFSAPWLDGPTALGAVVERSAELKPVTTVSLATLRGPIPLAKALVALDILSDGRVIAASVRVRQSRRLVGFGLQHHSYQERCSAFGNSRRDARTARPG